MGRYQIAETLRDDVARLDQVLALPECERARWAAGIAKLEQRIEEKRKACGLDIDTIAAQVYRAFDRGIGLQRATEALARIDAAYRGCDIDSLAGALEFLNGEDFLDEQPRL